MKIKFLGFFLLASAALNAGAPVAPSVTLGFDNSRSDYGAFETTGVDTALAISGPSSSTDFSSFTGLSSATYTISGAPLTSAFNFTATSSPSTFTLDGTGLDVGGGGIDSGESMKFKFTTDIILTEFDFSTLTATETATVSIAGIVINYDGNATNDAQSVSLRLSAGEELIFLYGGSNPADYDVQSISFEVVPEPGTYALLSGIFALGFVMLRRRTQ